MQSHPEAEFLAWAEARGIVVPPGHPQYPQLAFRDSAEERRFWVVPEKPEQRSFFLACVLELLDDWRSCWVWRHCGSWPSRQHVDPNRINDRVELVILEGLKIPVGTTDVVEFSQSEFDRLVSLLLSTSMFGWSVGEDLYVVPDNGCCIVKTDHHGVVHVEFRSAEQRLCEFERERCDT
jgi:hypothetical protein